jgi:hypothetical protein
MDGAPAIQRNAVQHQRPARHAQRRFQLQIREMLVLHAQERMGERRKLAPKSNVGFERYPIPSSNAFKGLGREPEISGEPFDVTGFYAPERSARRGWR